MMKAVARMSRKKPPTRPFKDFYQDWLQTLRSILLPLLRRSMLAFSANTSSTSATHLSSHVQMLHHHFQSYYHALDLAAAHDLSQLLFPSWHSPLASPFLWFADFHPNLFLHLLRSFLVDDDDQDGLTPKAGFAPKGGFSSPFSSPSPHLMTRIEQIECGLRLMVPNFVTRARKAQCGFITRVAGDWVRCEGKQEASKLVGEAVASNVEELLGVFLDVNRLRRSILSEIMGCTDVYQAALYLEALAGFFVGFADGELVREFEQCGRPL